MFTTQPRQYHSDSAKVLAAELYLKGDPKRWFTNAFLQGSDLHPAWLNSSQEFKAQLHHNWGLENPEGATESNLKKLAMMDKEHVAYFTSPKLKNSNEALQKSLVEAKAEKQTRIGEVANVRRTMEKV